MRRLVREIRSYFAGVEMLRVTPRVSPGEIRRLLAERFDFQRPQALEELIPEFRPCCATGRCTPPTRATSGCSTRGCGRS